MARPLNILNENDHELLLRILKGDIIHPKEYRRIRHIVESKHLRLKKGFDGLALVLNSREVVLRHQHERKMQILRCFHDERGHCGRDATYDAIRKYYYGINKEDIQTYLRQCDQCKYRQK